MVLQRLVLGLLATGAVVMGLFSGTAQAAPAIRGQNGPQSIKNSYIVVYKNNFLPSGVLDINKTPEGVAKGLGATIKHRYTSAVHGFAAAMPQQVAEKLAANPLVAYVEQDAVASIDGTQSNPTWGLDRIDQRNLPLDDAYTYPTTASNVTAYVIDTGVRISHQGFGGRASYGYDFVGNDTVADDCHGHGTHVAGTIGSSTHGVAKGVDIVAVRVLDCSGNSPYSRMIAGIDWITNNHSGPSVANMSIGGPVSSTLTNAVQNSINSGVVYAVSAGNNGTDACTQSPANLPAAITVGNATSSDARRTGSSLPSNYGSCLDLFAPGTQIVSTSYASNTATSTMTGTSMAAPHAAGVAALIYGANPSWTPGQVRDKMVADATSGILSNIGSGSPNKLLYVANGTVVTPPPTGSDCGPFTNNTPATIPDLGDGSTYINVTGCSGNASTTSQVTVNISHTARGDLKVYLVAADGTRYKLQDWSPGNTTDNLNATYTVDLSSQPRNQNWRLRAYDTISNNSGTLNSWSIKL